MSERDITANIGVLTDLLRAKTLRDDKQYDKKKVDSETILAVAAAAALLQNLLINIQRIADAQEILAQESLKRQHPERQA